MGKTRGDAIPLRRADPNSKKSSAYTFDRLEAVVAELVDSRRQLQVDNASLRKELYEQGQRVESLDERLLEANQRRQDALKRIDDLIARLDQIDSSFEAAASAGFDRVSKRTN